MQKMFRAVRSLAVWTLAIGSVYSPCASQVTAKRTVPLSANWEFRQVLKDATAQPTEWRPATVPGDVHLDLMNNHLIPDPYFRDNESKLQWIENADWEYRTTFSADAGLLNTPHVDLVFDGLDTNASVYLNDHLVLTADNMFRQWRCDAKRYLHPGSNQLRVEFHSPIKAAADLAASDPTQANTHIPDKSYLRKAAYEYGWDWGPRFVTDGIWKPVYLEAWHNVRIEDVYIAQPYVSTAQAQLNVSADVESAVSANADLEVTYSLKGHPTEISQKFSLHPGRNSIDIPVTIAKPALWYPAGYGEQPIYTFDVKIKIGNEVEDKKSVETGLKSVVLRRDRDSWGRSFEFVVNGIPVFAKGADVIPFDSFPNRVTEARYRDILQSAKDANMNMIRLWGGGYYESDEFYTLCDKLGLMVWQDFMFASSWYPGSVDWKRNVEAEVDHQVRRLRNHPSITLWSGNNEVESVLNAFLGGLSADGRLEVWKNYLATFSGIIPRVVAQDDPQVPYWPSSPSSDYEDTSDKFQSGDAHDWSIWHGREPFINYTKHNYRFTSEYGFQSFPELRTVESFTNAEDRASIFTPVMLAHQKNNEGNAIIHDYLLRDYNEPKDFASFLYVSQVLQAEGVKTGAEHMRRSRPRIMGSLYWQLNDCWPVASWSSIDYYGRWKALQYYARRFYSPLLVSPVLEDGKVSVYVVSDKTQPTVASLRIRVMSMQGTVSKEDVKQITIAPLSSTVYLQLPLENLLTENRNDLSQQVLVADLIVDGEQASSNLMYFAPTKQVHLLPAKLATELTQAGTAYKLKISSEAIARDVYITFGDLSAKISDNFFDVIPGAPKEITITTQASLTDLQKQLKVISLEDAFAPQTASH